MRALVITSRGRAMLDKARKHAPEAPDAAMRRAVRRPRRSELTRVTLRNFRSIEACDVALGRLVALVGPNGSGKSNFLDALQFTADALRMGLDNALEQRGGMEELRKRSNGRPTHPSVRIDFSVPEHGHGHYTFEIAAQKNRGFAVSREECAVGDHHFDVRAGQVHTFSPGIAPQASSERLFLVNASGFAPFGAVYEALGNVAVVSPNPEAMRELQKADPAGGLRRDARNVASVLRGFSSAQKARVEEFLSAVVPGISTVSKKKLGPAETLEFVQSDGDESWRFLSANMSDGTLRALAILVAVLQPGNIPLVGIEEPESALHPGAAGVLRDCLEEASRERQVLITSHSPELLDDVSWSSDRLRAVEMYRGTTRVTAIDPAAASAIKDRLFTAGELLRTNQLGIDRRAIPKPAQMRLFGDGDP